MSLYAFNLLSVVVWFVVLSCEIGVLGLKLKLAWG